MLYTLRTPNRFGEPNATALAPDVNVETDADEHCSHAVSVLAVLPEGRAAVDPV